MSGLSAKITSLCDGWLAAVDRTDGSMLVDEAAHKLRLSANKIDFESLDIDDLQACGVGLSKVLLTKKLNQLFDADHFRFWSWSAELIVRSQTVGQLKCLPDHLSDHFHAAFAAALIPCWAPKPEHQPQVVSAYGRFNHLYLTTLAFPLLEGALRHHCSEFVDRHGKVVKDFSPTSGKKYSKNEQCSSLQDLLLLAAESLPTKALWADFRSALDNVAPGGGGFRLVYEWRNDALHAASPHPAIGAVLLNMAIVIALEDLRPTFEDLRNELQTIRLFWIKKGFDPWTFMPSE